MKRLNIVFVMTFVFLGVSSVFSQTGKPSTPGTDMGFKEFSEEEMQKNLSNSVGNPSLVYFDAVYRPAQASNYTYKRVIKYKEPIINQSLNLGTDIYGNTTVNPTASPTGMHICSLTDYYETGEPALAANLITYYPNCSHGYLHGQATFYYKNGQVKSAKPYNVGKLQGTVIFYSRNGTEYEREDYEKGILIEKDKFPVPADSPILGTWKYIEYGDAGLTLLGNVVAPPTVKLSLIIIYYQNGTNETKKEVYSATREIVKRNWKYILKDSSSGVVEEYLGNELTERGNVKWINRNQFEYTVTFAQNSNAIGVKLTFTRQ